MADITWFPHPFRDAAWDVEDTPLTLTDLKLTDLSYALRSKTEWWRKYKESTIRDKWKKEALEIEFPDDERKLTPEEVDWVLEELAGYEKLRDHISGIQPSCFARIYESDTLIPEDILNKLKAGVSKLENIPEEKKDWHPRSDGLVLDLVHPSLYCLVYSRTKCISPEDSTKLQAIKPPTSSTWGLQRCEEWALSKRFAWIPTDFTIASDGSSAKANSYINNMQSHPDMYPIIEELVARFVLLFDRVLTDCLSENQKFVNFLRITGIYSIDEDELGSEPEEDDEDEDDGPLSQWQERRRELIVPPTVPETGYKTDISERTTLYSLAGRQIQVIVKLANIHLTPEKPSYTGGTWHVEGMANEAIIASGIYYYDTENVTTNQLAFRRAVSSMELNYEQSDEDGLSAVWGLDGGTEANQRCGEIMTTEGRCIAFTNKYQHCVSPFQLVDPTKPGHRKIVALFLVHPEIRIPSTSTIPDQQAYLSREAIHSSLDNVLPTELLDLIGTHVANQFTEEEAKKNREELMDERSAFVSKVDDRHFSVNFSFCEH